MSYYTSEQSPVVAIQPFGPHGYTVTYRQIDQDFLHAVRRFQGSLGPDWMSRVEVGDEPDELRLSVFPRDDLLQSIFLNPPRYGRRK